MLKPKNRVIMISGANRGIGLSTAKILIDKGYLVSLGARNPDNIPIDTESGKIIKCRWDAKKKLTKNIPEGLPSQLHSISAKDMSHKL